MQDRIEANLTHLGELLLLKNNAFNFFPTDLVCQFSGQKFILPSEYLSGGCLTQKPVVQCILLDTQAEDAGHPALPRRLQREDQGAAPRCVLIAVDQDRSPRQGLQARDP